MHWSFGRQAIQIFNAYNWLFFIINGVFWSLSLGSEGPGTNVKIERPVAGEDTADTVLYNPHASLSINLQRQRLPIFKVSK